jgi:hypothetical protein
MESEGLLPCIQNSSTEPDEFIPQLSNWLIYHKALSVFETEFVKGWRITDNISVIEIIMDKYGVL